MRVATMQTRSRGPCGALIRGVKPSLGKWQSDCSPTVRNGDEGSWSPNPYFCLL